MATEDFENSFIYKAFLADGWNIDNYYEHEFKDLKVNEIKAKGLGVDISKAPVNPYLEFHASIFLEDIQYDNETHTYNFENRNRIINDVNQFYDVFHGKYSDEVAKAVIQGHGDKVTISGRDFFPHIDNPERFGGHHAGHIYLRDPIVAYIDSHYNYVSTHSISEIVDDISKMGSCFMDISKVMDASIAHELEQVGQFKDNGHMYYSEFLNKAENLQPIATFEKTTQELFYNPEHTKVTFFDIGENSVTCCVQVNGESYPIETLPSEIHFNGKEDVLSINNLHSHHVPGVILVNDIKAIDKDSCLDKLTNLKNNIPKQSKESIQKDEQSR